MKQYFPYNVYKHTQRTRKSFAFFVKREKTELVKVTKMGVWRFFFLNQATNQQPLINYTLFGTWWFSNLVCNFKPLLYPTMLF
jgi:hypothetical protein